MKTKVHAVIERASDGTYGIYTKEEFKDFVLIASGNTPDEAKEDLYEVVEELREDVKNMPDFDFEFSYDIASFLRMFKEEFSMSGLQVITGINQKQLHHYLTGVRKPSPETVSKIEKGIKDFSNRLSEIQFA